MHNIISWLIVLGLAFLAGRLISLLRLPSILGWLITGMILGPYGFDLLSESLRSEAYYQIIISWMQIAFGLMLGTELVWKKIRSYGRALVVTTLTQSLGTFVVVSLAFGVVFWRADIPLFLAPVFGSIALATAPAPALSIVQEFHTKGPVTDTLLPMSVLDDIVGIVVFFSVNAVTGKLVNGGATSWLAIPVMIFLPILIGLLPGWGAGLCLRRAKSRAGVLTTLLAFITASMLLTRLAYRALAPSLSPNYMLVGVSFSAVFSNMIPEDALDRLNAWYQPVLNFALITAIVDLGAPLNYHLILGAGAYTVLYIASRAAGKYFGARLGAAKTHMPETVQKYLGLTLLPHSGVSLVFTSIACSTLAGEPALAQIVQGTIAAAAVINEIIAVIVSREGFRLAGEMNRA